MSPQKIMAITYNRSEYDLLSYLYSKLTEDKCIDFRLLVGGAHFSPTFNNTIDHIKKDGHDILGEIECLIDGDTDRSRLQSASIFLSNAIPLITSFKPDLILYAGDREEVLMGAVLGGFLQIPTMHFFAGDHDCDGTIDNPVRHATSKLSTYLMTSLEEHSQRLLSLGENKERIYNIGSPALDKFINEEEISIEKILGKREGFNFKDYALVIYHPLMGQEKESLAEFKNILETLEKKKISAIINTPNIDPSARGLISIQENFKQKNGFVFINNLPRNEFVNVYRKARFQIGNSSSGTCEAASVPLPVVNVGKRMVGRQHQGNVIFCDGDESSIGKAIDTVCSEDFLKTKMKGLTNIYGDGHSSQKAFDIIKKLDLSSFSEFRKEDPLELSRKNQKDFL